MPIAGKGLLDPPPDRAQWDDPWISVAHVLGKIVVVSVDGEQIKWVISYCISEGWVEHYATADDKPVVAPDGENWLVKKTLGKVMVEYHDQT